MEKETARSVQKKYKGSQLAAVPPMIQLANRTVLERPVAAVSVINFIVGFLSALIPREGLTLLTCHFSRYGLQ